MKYVGVDLMQRIRCKDFSVLYAAIPPGYVYQSSFGMTEERFQANDTIPSFGRRLIGMADTTPGRMIKTISYIIGGDIQAKYCGLGQVTLSHGDGGQNIAPDNQVNSIELANLGETLSKAVCLIPHDETIRDSAFMDIGANSAVKLEARPGQLVVVADGEVIANGKPFRCPAAFAVGPAGAVISTGDNGASIFAVWEVSHH